MIFLVRFLFSKVWVSVLAYVYLATAFHGYSLAITTLLTDPNNYD